MDTSIDGNLLSKMIFVICQSQHSDGNQKHKQDIVTK